MMDSEVICNPKKNHSLNNIGLRDASASKNLPYHLLYKRQAKGIAGVKEVKGKEGKDRRASDRSAQNLTGTV